MNDKICKSCGHKCHCNKDTCPDCVNDVCGNCKCKDHK